MIKNNDYTSSQQSIAAKHAHNIDSIKTSVHSSVFVKNFCLPFSTSFSSISKHEDFYTIKPSNDPLQEYLMFNSYFRYDFERTLASNMFSLMVKGKAHSEIVFYRDKSSNLKGIEFVPLNPYKTRKRSNYTDFYSKKQRLFDYRILNKNLVVMDLKETGFKRTFFKKVLINMAKLERIEYNSTRKVISPSSGLKKELHWFDFEILRINQKTFWNPKLQVNYFINDSYRLYREANYKTIRLNLLDYILNQYNSSIDKFKKEYHFSGNIRTSVERIDYKKHLQDFTDGLITTKQLTDMIIMNQIS